MRTALLGLALLCALAPGALGVSPSRLFEGIIAADAEEACIQDQVCLYLVYGRQTRDAVQNLNNLADVSFTEQIMPGFHYAVMTREAAALAPDQDGIFWIRRIPPAIKIDRGLKTLIDATGTINLNNETVIYAKLNIASQGNALGVTTFMENFAVGTLGIGAGSIDAYPTKNSKIAARVPYTQLRRVVEWLASNPLVQWVEERKVHKTFNKFATRAVQSTNGLSRPIFDQGIDGSGEVIGIADTGVDYDHCAFRDADRQIKICPTRSRSGTIALGDEDKCEADEGARKVILYRWFEDKGLLQKAPSCTGNWPCRTSNVGDNVDGHGTHVAGSAAGRASSSISSDQAFSDDFDGAAPNAKLIVDDISPGLHNSQASLEGIPDDLETGLFPITYGAAVYARIHSNSWGSVSNSYTTFSQEIDSFMFNQDDFLVLVAAGNSGGALATVGSPATCKNCLSVGATTNTKEAGDEYTIGGLELLKLTTFSSRGPTSDLRIKPEILCPGQAIKSARGDGTLNSNQCGRDTELTLSGTSMATPICAGSVALVRQYLRQGWLAGGTKNSGSVVGAPTASLLKAFMIHSARPAKIDGGSTVTTEINMKSGFGLVDLSSVLRFEGANYDLRIFDEVTVSDGEKKNFVFSVQAGQRFRVTLVWTDPPGNPAAFFQLQNNLDLVIQGPNNQFWYGNEGRTVTEAHTIREFDLFNPAERITIASPTAGTYRIQVRGVKVRDPQKFSLVITGGGLEQLGESAISQCPSDCSGAGTCDQGRCMCNIDRYGDDCSLEIPRLAFDGSKSVEVSANGFGYYIFYKQRANAEYVLTFSGTKDPDYFIAYNRRPSPSVFDLILAREGADGTITISRDLPRGFYVLGVLAYGDDVTATVRMQTDDDECGDGTKNANEECDDGNKVNGDQCTWWCRTSSGTEDRPGTAPAPSEPGNMFESPDEPGTIDSDLDDPNMNAAQRSPAALVLTALAAVAAALCLVF